MTYLLKIEKILTKIYSASSYDVYHLTSHLSGFALSLEGTEKSLLGIYLPTDEGLDYENEDKTLHQFEAFCLFSVTNERHSVKIKLTHLH